MVTDRNLGIFRFVNQSTGFKSAESKIIDKNTTIIISLIINKNHAPSIKTDVKITVLCEISIFRGAFASAILLIVPSVDFFF